MENFTSLSNLLYELGRNAGSIAFLLLSFLIFLGDTARFWDKFLGLDKIIKFQKKFSFIVLIFVIFHPLLFILSKQTIAEYLIPDFTQRPLAFGIIAFYIFIVIMIASSLYKFISYKVWQYIHIGTYFLYFLVLAHAIFLGSEPRDLAWLYISSFIAIVIGIIYRTKYKIKTARRNKFTVEEVKMETHDSFSLKLKSENNFDFKAGQFCFLRINKNKLYARHPFTISSAPGDSNLSFTIKQSGRFTETARNLKIGDKVTVDGPFGKFIPNKKFNLVFIAGGVGITPFMSILKDYLNNGIQQKITLIYGARKEEDIIFKNEIEEIKEDWFNKVYVLSGENNRNISCEIGHVSKEIIEKHVKDTKNSLYYICGPELMKNSVKKILAEMGIKKRNIFIEDFFW